MFVAPFTFAHKEKLKLSPDDKTLLIYRVLYFRKEMSDALELETLAKDIESRNRLKLGGVWHEHLILGDLFAVVRKPASLIGHERARWRLAAHPAGSMMRLAGLSIVCISDPQTFARPCSACHAFFSEG